MSKPRTEQLDYKKERANTNKNKILIDKFRNSKTLKDKWELMLEDYSLGRGVLFND